MGKLRFIKRLFCKHKYSMLTFTPVFEVTINEYGFGVSDGIDFYRVSMCSKCGKEKIDKPISKYTH